MKKVLSSAILAAFLLALCSCGGGNNTPPGAADATPSKRPVGYVGENTNDHGDLDLPPVVEEVLDAFDQLDPNKPSEGLLFEQIKFLGEVPEGERPKPENYYDAVACIGIGSCTDEYVVIPATVWDLPVVRIKRPNGDYDAWKSDTMRGLVIPENVIDILDDTFEECPALEKVSLPSTLKSIGSFAFRFCPNLTKINFPEGLEEIKSWAFENSPGIKSIKLPASLKIIGGAAFRWSELDKVEVDANNPNFTVVDGVLFTKDMKELCLYPAGLNATTYKIPEGVETIRAYSFNNNVCTTVVIPDTVTTIENGAFECCMGLVRAHIPANATLPEYADWGDPGFNYSYDLVEVTVDEANLTWTSVDGVLFTKDMSILVTYPSGKPGSSYTIPANVKSVSNGAFMGTKLKDIIVTSSNTEFGDDALNPYAEEHPTIHCYPGSLAQAYARENGIPYELM